LFQVSLSLSRSLVTWLVQIASIGSAVVMLLVCSQLVSDLIDRSHTLSYGVWIVLIAVVICPLMWLGTPVEFWGAAALALGTSTITVILLLIDMIKDLKALETSPRVSAPTATSISLAFGTFMFAYGGTAPFPTYQNDMKEKDKWPQAVIMGFIILFVLFTPFAIIGYLAYGSSVSNNIIHSVRPGLKRDIVTILMAGHLFFAFLLMINPSVQDIENKIKAQRKKTISLSFCVCVSQSPYTLSTMHIKYLILACVFIFARIVLASDSARRKSEEETSDNALNYDHKDVTQRSGFMSLIQDGTVPTFLVMGLATIAAAALSSKNEGKLRVRRSTDANWSNNLLKILGNVQKAVEKYQQLENEIANELDDDMVRDFNSKPTE
ncbi:uncharacterized protein LOC128392004, partial [Panonychus citri]|uniref:uncharacterized protein LOC128392004 n=2 Tax=Panonychus citri TaxID=50023 RepID=UPI002307BEC9